MNDQQKILVVEDDPIFRNYLYQVLKFDYDVMVCSGSREALQTLEQDTFKLMITDLRMPEMDGRELVARVHDQLDPQLMVIVITAFEDDWPVDDALGRHVFRYLRKGGFTPGELKQDVNKAFEIRRSMDSLEAYKQRVDLSERLYREMFDKAADAFFVTDGELSFITTNDGFDHLSGYARGDLSGRSLTDLCSPEHRPAVDALREQLRHDDGPHTREVVFCDHEGTPRRARLWVRRVRDVQGHEDAVFGHLHELPPAQPAAKRPPATANRDRLLAGRLRRLSEHTCEPILWLDGQGRCTFVNEALVRLLDYPAAEWLGRPIDWERLLYPEDLPRVDQWRRAIEKREACMEATVRLYDNASSLHTLNVRASVAYSDEGAPLAMDLAATDLTERCALEQQLRQTRARLAELDDPASSTVGRKIRRLQSSEERYRHIVEEFITMVFAVDGEGLITYCNQAGLSILGARPDDLLGRPCTEIFADARSVDDMNDAVTRLRAGQTPRFVLALETVQGKRLFRVNTGMLGDDDAPEYVCVARDVTDEVANGKRAKLLANIEHYSADAIIGLDTERNIISWNRGASMMFGWQENEAVGRTAFIIVPDEVHKEAKDVLDEVRRKGYVKDLATRRRTKDGTILDVALTMTVLHDVDERIMGFSAIIKDMSDQKKMEAALVQSERLAATGKLAASIAHEINNPLYGIRSCLTHVLACEDGEVDRKFVQLAVKESDRIAELIRNMKTSYMPSEARIEQVDIDELLRDVFVLNRKYLEERRVRLDFTAGDLPTVACVPDQIKQVFINLLTNAADAMPSGGFLTVRTNLAEDADDVIVSFTDSGVGIAEEDLPHIFDMFYTKKPSVKGVGLGLSVSYGIVMRHGGKIEVTSEQDKGACFAVRLPVQSHWQGRQLKLNIK